MTFTTAVPEFSFGPNGPVEPAESAILAGVLSDMNTAFGGGMNESLTTPQGQLAQSLAAIIGDCNDQLAAVANNVNPSVASGPWQDAIGLIYFLERIPAAGTVVACNCVGLAGTVIPAGTIAQDANGYQYVSLATATIPFAGTVSISFQNVTTGAIACAPGSLTQIYTTITGWESITNPAAGVLGNAVESRANFETRRRNSVALNAVNSTQSIYANVLNVSGVVDALVVDNPTGGPVSFGASGYVIAPNSICASVAGGASLAVALAIWNKKSQGCGYTGNTTVTVQDTVNYSSAPYPTYNVTYLTPTSTPAYFVVQISNNPALAPNIVALIQAAVVAAFTGTDGGIKVRIGATTYAGRYYPGVAATDPNVQILSILMGTTAATAVQPLMRFGIDQLPTISSANIVVDLV